MVSRSSPSQCRRLCWLVQFWQVARVVLSRLHAVHAVYIERCRLFCAHSVCRDHAGLFARVARWLVCRTLAVYAAGHLRLCPSTLAAVCVAYQKLLVPQNASCVSGRTHAMNSTGMNSRGMLLACTDSLSITARTASVQEGPCHLGWIFFAMHAVARASMLHWALILSSA